MFIMELQFLKARAFQKSLFFEIASVDRRHAKFPAGTARFCVEYRHLQPHQRDTPAFQQDGGFLHAISSALPPRRPPAR